MSETMGETAKGTDRTAQIGPSDVQFLLEMLHTVPVSGPGVDRVMRLRGLFSRMLAGMGPPPSVPVPAQAGTAAADKPGHPRAARRRSAREAEAKSKG